MHTPFWVVVPLAIVLTVGGCAATPPREPPATATSTEPSVPPPSTGPFNQGLHDELVAMLERDQTPDGGGESSQAHTDRLEEIILEFGWPTVGLVGEDDEEAAWAIAQHSDLDSEFQRFALSNCGPQ